MAVLQKIRTHSVILFTVIIVALLAFILGDFFNSGRNLFGVGDTVAKANGAKVSLNEYQKLYSEYSNQFKDQGVNNDMMEEMAIRNVLRNALLDQEYDRLGITVTDNELSKFISNPQLFPYIIQVFAQKGGFDAQGLMQSGFANVATLRDAGTNPQKYKLTPEIAQAFNTAWIETEKEITLTIKRQLYMQLLSGLFTANNIDAKADYNEMNTDISYSYAAKDYVSVPDNKVNLTDADYKAYYDKHPGMFKLQEDSRFVHFISVPVQPSQADIKAISDEMQTLLTELSDTVADPATIVRKHKNFEYNSFKASKSQLAMQQGHPLQMLAASIDSLAVGTARQLPVTGNDYTAYKLISRSTGIDSVRFTTYPVEVPDSLSKVMARLTDANIDSLARLIQPQLVDQVQSLVGAADDNKFAKLLQDAPLNTLIAYNDTVNGQPVAAVIDVKYRSAAVPVFELGIASFTLTPSSDTERDLGAKLRNFVGVNGTAESFVKNATKAGYEAQWTLVNASTPLGQMAPNSMVALKWAMNADKGAVSKVFTFNLPGSGSYLLALCVDEIFDGDYIPADAAFVKEVLKPVLTQQKKAEIVAAQYKGKAKTLADAARLMGTDVQEGNASFAGNNGPELLAALATAKPGTLVGPVKGNGQVYFVQVKGSKLQGRPYNFDESRGNFIQNNLGGLFEQLPTREMLPSLDLLVGDNRITNNILEFTAGDEK